MPISMKPAEVVQKKERKKEREREGNRNRETETFPSALVSFQLYSTTCAEGLK